MLFFIACRSSLHSCFNVSKDTSTSAASSRRYTSLSVGEGKGAINFTASFDIGDFPPPSSSIWLFFKFISLNFVVVTAPSTIWFRNRSPPYFRIKSSGSSPSRNESHFDLQSSFLKNREIFECSSLSCTVAVITYDDFVAHPFEHQCLILG